MFFRRDYFEVSHIFYYLLLLSATLIKDLLETPATYKMSVTQSNTNVSETSLDRLDKFIEHKLSYLSEANKKYQFFYNTWYVIQNIENSLNNFNFKYYNTVLKDILDSESCRHIFAIHEDFRELISNYLYDLEMDGTTIWPKCWPSIFGCEFNDIITN